MCRPADCRTCGKTTWEGCGEHVDQVMRRIPRDQQCTCQARAAAPASPPERSLISRLLGR